MGSLGWIPLIFSVISNILKCELRAKKPEQSSKNKMRQLVCREHEPKVDCMSEPCWHIKQKLALSYAKQRCLF